jgi:hypothetical protein
MSDLIITPGLLHRADTTYAHNLNTTTPQSTPVEAAPEKETDLFANKNMGASSTAYHRDSLTSAPVPVTMAALTSKDEQEKTVNEPSFLKRLGEWASSFFWKPTPAQTTSAANTSAIGTDAIETDVNKDFAKPVLDQPDYLDEKTSFRLNNQMNAFMDAIRREKSEASNSSKAQVDEMDVQRLFGASWVKHKSNKDGISILSKKEVMDRMEAKEKLYAHSMELERERQNASGKSGVLSWISGALGIGAVAGTGVILASGLMTTAAAGGTLAAALATVTGTLPILVGVATIAQGVSLGAKYYYDHTNETKTKELLGVKADHEEHQYNIDNEMSKIKSTIQYQTQYWKQRKEMEESRYQTARFR